MVKNPPANTGDSGDVGLIPGSRRSLGGGNGNSLQYSCLENSMDGGAWHVGYSPWSHKESDITEYGHGHAHTHTQLLLLLPLPLSQVKLRTQKERKTF